jgi:hypothetical protein
MWGLLDLPATPGAAHATLPQPAPRARAQAGPGPDAEVDSTGLL